MAVVLILLLETVVLTQVVEVVVQVFVEYNNILVVVEQVVLSFVCLVPIPHKLLLVHPIVVNLEDTLTTHGLATVQLNFN